MVGQQLTRTAVSDETGFFNFLAMPRGNYEITSQLTGFTTQHAKAELTAGENLRVDFRMSLGQLQRNRRRGRHGRAGRNPQRDDVGAGRRSAGAGAAAQRPQRRRAGEHAAGHHRRAGVSGDGQHARRSDDDRARRLSRAEQLHAERRELHQLLADRRLQSAAARRGAGNPRADVDVFSRVRQQRRRTGDDGHQGGQQPVPRVGVGIPPQ